MRHTLPAHLVSTDTKLILKTLHSNLTKAPHVWGLHFRQQDISGFFNSVEHDRIIFCVERLLQRFIQQQRLPCHFSVQVQQKHRLSRVFRGAWRRETSSRVFHLSHVPDLVGLILRTSLAQVGVTTVRQVRGASIGNPAPRLCVEQWRHYGKSPSTNTAASDNQASVVTDLRYVDNRFVHHIAGDELHWPWRFFFHPFFYRPPLLLDHVDSEDVMGFRINYSNHSIFMKVSTETDSFRSTSSACSSATVLSGFRARALFAFRFTRPRSAIQDTIQQLQAQYLRAGLPRELLLSETRKLEQRFHVCKTSALLPFAFVAFGWFLSCCLMKLLNALTSSILSLF